MTTPAPHPTYAGKSGRRFIVVYSSHGTGIAQALEEAARVIQAMRGSDDPWVVDEREVTLNTTGIQGFEITLPLVLDTAWVAMAHG